MAKVRSKGNYSTELRLIKMFRDESIVGWRRNYPLVGKPDFVFTKARLAIFVDGCFWRGCPLCYKQPKSNCRFWKAKVERNRQRDAKIIRELRSRGWSVLRIWEHDLRAKKSSGLIKRIRRALAKIMVVRESDAD